MTIFTDDIGAWNNLGTVETERKQWLKFPITATGGGRVLRIHFECSDWLKLSSYTLIRPRYSTSNTDQIGLPLRISPSSIPVIFEMPIPIDLLQRSITFRNFEIYKVSLRRPKLIGITTYPLLKARLEELWD